MHFGHGSKLSVVDTETEGEPGLMVKSHGAFCVLRNREMTGKLVTRALQLDRAVPSSVYRDLHIYIALYTFVDEKMPILKALSALSTHLHEFYRDLSK